MLKKEARVYLTEGNTKLDKSIGIFNLPAVEEVCGRICKGCYAINSQIQYKSVLPSRYRKLEFSKQLDFETKIRDSIVSLRLEYVRVHESGEFYSQVYVDRWYRIAKSLPDVTFVAYSKRFGDFDFSKLRSLDNVILINSLHDNGRLNYGKLERKADSMELCPSMGENKIGCRKGCNMCYDRNNKVKLEQNGLYFIQH